MPNLAVIAIVFALIFVAELPDKSAIASLVLGTRYPVRWVFTGVAAAFFVHAVVSVAAGSLIALLPRRPVEAIVATLFLLGAVLLWRRSSDSDDEAHSDGIEPPDGSRFKIVSLSFGIIFVAEFGDLTQILTANLAAKYRDPLAVGIGSVLGLWAVGLLAILGGKSLLRVLPMKFIERTASIVMVGFAAYSVYVVITN